MQTILVKKMSDSEESFDENIFKVTNTRRFNAKKRPDTSSSEDSDSDDDSVISRNKRKAQSPCSIDNGANEAKRKTLAPDPKTINLLDDSSDDEDLLPSASTHANPMMRESSSDNKAVRDAQLAREKLMEANMAKLDDTFEEEVEVDEEIAEPNVSGFSRSLDENNYIDLESDDDDLDISFEVNNIANNGPRVKLKLRINGNEKDFESVSVVVTDPFQKLFDAICTGKGANPSQVTIELDGDRLNLNSCCKNEDLEGDEILDVKIVGPCNQGRANMSNEKRIKLKMRVNGNEKEIHILQISTTDPFQKLIDAFCKKVGRNSSSVKFTLDGDPLNVQSCCKNEDLEGGEIIDVIM